MNPGRVRRQSPRTLGRTGTVNAMYVLDFLKGQLGPEADGDGVIFDYRLLCSGELYNARVVTFDWRKSDAARVLFDSPFSLAVCSGTCQQE